MQNLQKLRAAGYDIQPAQDAVDCTEVLSIAPFWYYNATFYGSMAGVHNNLLAAKFANGKYRLLLAGKLDKDEFLAFNILSQTQKEKMDEARGKYVFHSNEASRAQDDYMDALADEETD